MDFLPQLSDSLRHIRLIHFTLLILELALFCLALLDPGLYEKMELKRELEVFRKEYTDLRLKVKSNTLTVNEALPDNRWQEYRRLLESKLGRQCGSQISLPEALTPLTIEFGRQNSFELPSLDSAKINEIDAAMKTFSASLKTVTNLRPSLQELKKITGDMKGEGNYFVITDFDLPSFDKAVKGRGSITMVGPSAVLVRKARDGAIHIGRAQSAGLKVTLPLDWTSAVDRYYPFKDMLSSRSPTFIDWWERMEGFSVSQASQLAGLDDPSLSGDQELELMGIKLRGRRVAALLPVALAAFLYLIFLYEKGLTSFINNNGNFNRVNFLSPWAATLPGYPALLFGLLTLGILPLVVTLQNIAVLDLSLWIGIFVLAIVVMAAFFSVWGLIELRFLLLKDRFCSALVDQARQVKFAILKRIIADQRS